MRKYSKALMAFLALTILIVAVGISGCPAPNTQPAPPPNAVPDPQAPGGPGPAAPQPGPYAPTPGPGAPQPIAPAPQAPQPGTPQADTQEQRRLATMVNRIPEVNSSSLIVTGNRAIVGLNLRPNIDAGRVEAIENEATRIVKRANNEITAVTVTSDPDLVSRIRGIADGLREGQSLSAFTDELAEINRRLGPTTR